MTRADCLRLALLASSALAAVPATAGDRLPVGASVAHGRVDITTPAAGAMAIRQSTSTAIVNWRGFSIGEGARVDIRQPSTSSAMLNRVTGQAPSSIAGQLNANGQVYLVNPNGIAITPTGTVRTGAFVASTLATTDEDFIAGRRSFHGDGRSAAVVNRGAIEIGRGGYAALIGGRVDNSGSISAPLGRIGLGAGERATLDVSGDGFLQIAEPSADDGDDAPLISQSGRLTADGGRVEIKAATARRMAREVVNLSGVVQARSVSGRSGAIVLGGGAGGKVRVTGRLDASALRTAMPASIETPPARPGAITITGRAIELAGARLDASGPAGGGSVRVGGDRQGKGTLQRAATTTVDAATTIAADALVAGDGGSVIVWSDERTSYEGAIQARGGPQGGDGGFAEVSGKDRLWFAGGVDLSAPAGRVGNLLIDPVDIAIVEDPAGDNEIAAATVEAVLGDVNMTISTDGEGEDDGNITVAAPLTWTPPTATPTVLILQADNDIAINAPITAPAGGLSLEADNAIGINAPVSVFSLTSTAGGDTRLDAALSISAGGSLSMNGPDIFLAAPVTAGADANLFVGAGDGSLEVTGAITVGGGSSLTLAAGTGDVLLGATITLGAFSDAAVFAGSDITITGAVSGPTGDLDIGAGGTIDAQGPVDVDIFTLSAGDWVQLGTPLPAFSADDFRIQDGEGGDSTFLRALGGNGTPGAPYLIADAYGLQGIGSSFTVAGGVPDLEDSYALAGDIDASGTAGWNDSEGAAGFNPIGTPDTPFLGTLDGRLFSIADLTITRLFEESVGLFDSVGFGGTVRNLTLVDADIEGGPTTGGIAGVNGGLLSAVRMDGGSVTGNSTGDEFIDIDVGGIAGRNESAITRSASSASVNGTGFTFNVLHLGGLVGVNDGTVSDSMASGAVEGTGAETMFVGGLVGQNQPEGRILRAYATGSVTATEAIDGAAGGLVGNNAGTIDQTYATGAVAGPAEGASGGLVGAFFFPEVEDGGPVTLALPPVLGVTSSYFDINTTGQTTSSGGFGITTAAFQNTASFMAAAGIEGWSFTDTWSPPDPGHYPELYSVAPVIWADIGDASAIYGSTAGIRAPVTRSGGPGTYAFDRSTVPPALPLNAPGVATGGVGTYAVTTVPTVTSTGGVPYRVFSTPGTLTVTPAPLVITADDRSKRYGQELGLGGTAFAARGLVNGDSVSRVDLASRGAARGASVGDSPFAITASNATGAGLLNPSGVSNYTIRYEPGALTVTPAPLVITADDGTKRYGRELGFNGTEFTARGLLNGDSVNRVDLASLGSGREANVGEGPFAITASNARGTGVSNYTISYRPGTLAVTPAPLVVTADDIVKLFGSTFTFDGTEFTSRGLVNGDQVLSALLRSDGSPSAAPVSRDPYRIDISGAAGTGLSFDGVANYDISYVPGEMLVVPFDPSVLPTFNAGLRLVYYTQLPNPDDVIEIADTEDFGAGGGPILGPVRGAGLTLARQTAQDALTFVGSISDRLERRVAECEPVRPDPDSYLDCVSEALSQYANELDSRILDLPEPLRRVSAVIRESAREIEGVRADAARRLALATTDAEREAIARDAAARAGAAMQTAVDEIRAAIQLIRAEDDPQLASLQSQQGETITAALQNVGDELTRAVGL